MSQRHQTATPKRFRAAVADRLYNAGTARAPSVAELRDNLCEVSIPTTRQYAWAQDDSWVISVEVDPEDWPAWCDDIAFTTSDRDAEG